MYIVKNLIIYLVSKTIFCIKYTIIMATMSKYTITENRYQKKLTKNIIKIIKFISKFLKSIDNINQGSYTNFKFVVHY